jgi:hypothetical protein
LGDEAALSGIYNEFSFSFGQLHYETNGFRQDNDIKHNIYNVFAQYEISPDVNFQAEYRHRETEHGDLELRGKSDIFDNTYRRKLEQDSYRYGLKVSPAQHSDLIFSFIHANRTESISQFDGFANLLGKTYSYDFEVQHLFHNRLGNTITGGGMYHTENDVASRFLLPNPICPSSKLSCLSDYNTTQYFGYFYSNFKLLDNLTLTSGLSFDHYRDNKAQAQAELNELNPKFGFLWQANNFLTLRGAVFKSVKSAIVDNQILQPTQIAGFNQFFDDLNGTVAWQYGVGLDTNLQKDIYTGIEVYKRDLKIPKDINFYENTEEELYRLYIDWTALTNLAINSEFRFRIILLPSGRSTSRFLTSLFVATLIFLLKEP